MKIKLLIVAILSTASSAYAGCGSSFCSVNTHWDTQGLASDDGPRVDLRYSYAKADTPRVGSNKVNNDPALATAGDEVENLRTINKLLNLDVDYPVNAQLSVAVAMPLVIRDHSHTIAPATIEQGSFSKLGDIRVLGNYKLDSSDHHAGNGLRFGLKLPTGSTTWEFQPAITGERSLQPGSGSTDILLGAYHHQDLENSPWGWFVSGQLQSAVSTKSDYRPGDSAALDVGGHYAFTQNLTGLLQLNAQFKKTDSGNASNPHSGGKSLNLSPGLSFNATPKTKLYSFVQLPLYQYANPDPAGSGYGQLTAPWSFSIGVSHSY
jgi:hypothetical protein